MATVLSLDPMPTVPPAPPSTVASLLLVRSTTGDAEGLLRAALAARSLRLLASDVAGGPEHGRVIAAEIVGSSTEIAGLAAALRLQPGIASVTVAEVGAARALRDNVPGEELP